MPKINRSQPRPRVLPRPAQGPGLSLKPVARINVPQTARATIGRDRPKRAGGVTL